MSLEEKEEEPKLKARPWKLRLLQHWLPLLLGLVVLGGLNWQIQEHLLKQENQNLLKHDQAANMRLARESFWQRQQLSEDSSLRERLLAWTPSRTDGVINPLWPLVSSFLPEMENFAQLRENANGEMLPKSVLSNAGIGLFYEGKFLNARLLTGFLLILGLGLGFRWHWLSVLNFVALASLAAFLPRGGYFQPEPLSYALSLLAWVLAIELIAGRARWCLLGLLGLVLGLSWLAKSSALLLLLGFVGVFGWRIWRDWLLEQKFPRQALLGLGLLLLVFGATIAPRYLYAQERYGEGLWSYPSAWMWFDHFDPGYQWMVEHSTATAQGLEPPAPPAAGLGEWLEAHSGGEFVTRLAGGTWQRAEEMFSPKPTRWKKGEPKLPWRNLLDHRGMWLVWVLGGVAFLSAFFFWKVRKNIAFLNLSKRDEFLSKNGKLLCLFVLGTLGVWLLSLGWYWPIANFAERFVLIIYVLLAYGLFWFVDQLRLLERGQQARIWRGCFWVLQLALLSGLLFRYSQLLRWPEFS